MHVPPNAVPAIGLNSAVLAAPPASIPAMPIGDWLETIGGRIRPGPQIRLGLLMRRMARYCMTSLPRRPLSSLTGDDDGMVAPGQATIGYCSMPDPAGTNPLGGRIPYGVGDADREGKYVMQTLQRPFGKLMLEILDALDSEDAALLPDAMSTAEIETGLADIHRRFALAQAEAGLQSEPVPVLTEADLIAFLDGARGLTQIQQQALFADAALRAHYHGLKRARAVRRTPPADAPAQAGTVYLLAMPAQIAAATEHGAAYERALEGGHLRVEPVGIDQQVYVIIDLEQPDDAPPTVLVLERRRDSRVERLELTPPEEGQIVLVRDLAKPDDAALVDLLRDPTTSGSFLH